MILLAALLTLEADSLALLLDRRLPADSEYVVLEAAAPDHVRARWAGREQPFAPGSLLKPKIALTWFRRHGEPYPVLVCRKGCWSPRPHGRMDLPHALAVSCNNYFHTLMEGSAPERLAPTELLRWYCDLVQRSAEPGVAPILSGLALAAENGTARGIGSGSLAKTGTGPCSHRPKGSGDGFVVVLTPAARPRVAILVRMHNRPGSQVAVSCGQVLQEWRRQR